MTKDQLLQLENDLKYASMRLHLRQMMSRRDHDPRLEDVEKVYNETYDRYAKAKRDYEINKIYAELRAQQPHACENELLEIAEMQYNLGIK